MGVTWCCVRHSSQTGLHDFNRERKRCPCAIALWASSRLLFYARDRTTRHQGKLPDCRLGPAPGDKSPPHPTLWLEGSSSGLHPESQTRSIMRELWVGTGLGAGHWISTTPKQTYTPVSSMRVNFSPAIKKGGMMLGGGGKWSETGRNWEGVEGKYDQNRLYDEWNSQRINKNATSLKDGEW